MSEPVVINVGATIAPIPSRDFVTIYRHESEFEAAGGIEAVAKSMAEKNRIAIVFIHTMDVAARLSFRDQDRFVAWYVGNLPEDQRERFIDAKVTEFRDADFTRRPTSS